MSSDPHGSIARRSVDGGICFCQPGDRRHNREHHENNSEADDDHLEQRHPSLPIHGGTTLATDRSIETVTGTKSGPGGTHRKLTTARTAWVSWVTSTSITCAPGTTDVTSRSSRDVTVSMSRSATTALRSDASTDVAAALRARMRKPIWTINVSSTKKTPIAMIPSMVYEPFPTRRSR